MRLIDAEQFGVISLQGKSEDFIDGVKFMLDKIDEAPTVDGIPRCSTCQYWNDNLKYCTRNSQFMYSDDYCSDHIKIDESKYKWLYRLEAVDPKNGLWYNEKCELVWGIGKLPDCKTKDLPMDYDERYHKDGKNWYSSCSRKEDLSHWYSLQDALDLIANGFVFTRYLATEYVEYEQETTFIKETALAREVLDITDIWEDNKNG